jgi:inhibitor of KinA
MIRIREAGDSALLLELDAAVDPAVNAHAVAIAATARATDLPGIRDVVSTYRTVAVYFDPLVVDVTAVGAMLERAARSEAGARSKCPSSTVGRTGPILPAWQRMPDSPRRK